MPPHDFLPETNPLRHLHLELFEGAQVPVEDGTVGRPCLYPLRVTLCAQGVVVSA